MKTITKLEDLTSIDQLTDFLSGTQAVAFFEDVKDVFGYALHLAQHGEKHLDAKPLKGFSGARIPEVVEDHTGVIHTEQSTL